MKETIESEEEISKSLIEDYMEDEEPDQNEEIERDEGNDWFSFES